MSFNRQMGKHEVKTIVIAQLEILGYLPPQSPTDSGGRENPAYSALVNVFCEDLCNFGRETLEAGMASFRQEWAYRRWPTIAELRGFMIAAQRAARPAVEQKPNAALPPPPPRPTAEEKARVAEKFARWKRDMASSYTTNPAKERQRQASKRRAEGGYRDDGQTVSGAG